MTFALNRRAALAALGAAAAGATGFGQAAQPPDAWRSSYTPHNGPLKAALDSGPLRIEGRWPATLQGTLYRVGPARRELGGVSMNHWFDGDGMLQAFRFEGGRVSHRGALLATPKLQAEEAAGRLLYSGFAQTLPHSPPLSGPDTVNPANINLLSLPASRALFALWDAGSALAVDPDSLQAKGFKVWSPDTQGAPFSAHPRVAPDGTVWSFGYMPGTGSLLLYEISPHGQLRRQQVIPAPQADMVHDFAITERHLVFLLMPLKYSGTPGTGNPLSHYRWEGQSPLVVLLVDKADFKVQRFELPATGVFHLANAWEQGGTVQVRFVAQPDILGAMQKMDVNHSHSNAKTRATQWTQITLTPATGQAQMQALGLDQVEFPRIHPARNGLRTQFTTLLARSREMNARVDGFDSVLTLHGGQQQRHRYGDGWIAEEHVYVPRTPTAPDGKGWVLGTAYHWPSERTALSVFDAAAVNAGPVANVTLPYGLPLGLHGQFVAA
ncbi:carotenoid oxygenase family protein [Polaromonas sp.]|uniref:carotenoid oxygenase family protein n=1 Tax=Polaromonas sp. TaxID=1869339 RepID=UPI003751380D